MIHLEDRSLDRKQQFDEKSRGFRAVAGIDTNPLRGYHWACEAWNDQGVEGACVGFGWSHELAARPYPVPTTNEQARAIYKRAQLLDEWPGEAYAGTSVLAGAKATMELVNTAGLAYMSEYRWAFGINDLLLVLGYRGPAVLGLDWWSNMFRTDANGFISATGTVQGGHCLIARGFKPVYLDTKGERVYSNLNLDQSYVTLRNSWGRDWGQNGDCKISVRDLDKLLRAGGDVCVPTLRRK